MINAYRMSKLKTTTATPFSNGDHYFAKTSPLIEGRRGWVYNGTLFRNGIMIATFIEPGNGGEMHVDWTNTVEQAAFNNWYHRFETGRFEHVDVDDDQNVDGMAIETVINRALDEADLRKKLSKRVIAIQPGDVRNGGKSQLSQTKVMSKESLVENAHRVQKNNPDRVVLNLLPFDAAFALLMTLDC